MGQVFICFADAIAELHKKIAQKEDQRYKLQRRRKEAAVPLKQQMRYVQKFIHSHWNLCSLCCNCETTSLLASRVLKNLCVGFQRNVYRTLC